MEWAQEEFDYALKEGLGPRKEHPIPWMHVSHITEVMRDRQALAIVRALWTRRDELAREYDIAPTCYCPTAPSSKWRNANHTTLRNSVRFAPSTNACASIPIPNRTRCSNGTRRFNAKSNRACGRTSSRTRSPCRQANGRTWTAAPRGVMNRSPLRLPNRFACGRNGIRNVCKCSTGAQGGLPDSGGHAHACGNRHQTAVFA